jgi:hypothetical protein
MWKRWFQRAPKSPAYITIVSGLPRSGTSMMMRMLSAGGMPVVTDNVRQADADNPHGYYELEGVKTLKHNPSVLNEAMGKACKVISLLLYDLPKDKPYRVIFMQRDLAEMLASQRTMLQRQTLTEQTSSDAEMSKIFAQHLDDIQAWLANQGNMKVLYVDYREAIADPSACAQAVNRFLDDRLDEQRILEAIDQNLYRNRSE